MPKKSSKDGAKLRKASAKSSAPSSKKAGSTRQQQKDDEFSWDEVDEAENKEDIRKHRARYSSISSVGSTSSDWMKRLKPQCIAMDNGKTIYCGETSHGVPHGMGVLIMPKGVQYQGMFSKGNYDGLGVLKNQDRGVVIAGEWYGGKKHGCSVERDAEDGSIVAQGQFEANRQTAECDEKLCRSVEDAANSTAETAVTSAKNVIDQWSSTKGYRCTLQDIRARETIGCKVRISPAGITISKPSGRKLNLRKRKVQITIPYGEELEIEVLRHNAIKLSVEDTWNLVIHNCNGKALATLVRDRINLNSETFLIRQMVDEYIASHSNSEEDAASDDGETEVVVSGVQKAINEMKKEEKEMKKRISKMERRREKCSKRRDYSGAKAAKDAREEAKHRIQHIRERLPELEQELVVERKVTAIVVNRIYKQIITSKLYLEKCLNSAVEEEGRMAELEDYEGALKCSTDAKRFSSELGKLLECTERLSQHVDDEDLLAQHHGLLSSMRRTLRLTEVEEVLSHSSDGEGSDDSDSSSDDDDDDDSDDGVEVVEQKDRRIQKTTWSDSSDDEEEERQTPPTQSHSGRRPSNSSVQLESASSTEEEPNKNRLGAKRLSLPSEQVESTPVEPSTRRMSSSSTKSDQRNEVPPAYKMLPVNQTPKEEAALSPANRGKVARSWYFLDGDEEHKGVDAESDAGSYWSSPGAHAELERANAELEQ